MSDEGFRDHRQRGAFISQRLDSRRPEIGEDLA